MLEIENPALVVMMSLFDMVVVIKNIIIFVLDSGVLEMIKVKVEV